MSSPLLKENSKLKGAASAPVEFVHKRDSAEVEAGRLSGSRILPENVKRWWVLEVCDPIETRLVRLKLTPNQISFLGLFATALACVMTAFDHLAVGGLLVYVAGSFDFLDGRVARITGQQRVSGGFFDSVLDRYMDALIFLGVLLCFESQWLQALTLLAWFGSSATSYVRAKAESLGQPCKGGAMQRPERILYIGTGLCLAGFWEYLQYPFRPAGWESSRFFLVAVVVFIALASNYVAIQRIWSVFKSLKKAEDA